MSAIRSKSIESFDRFEQIENQNYDNLRFQCQKSGTLFVDDIFPANDSSFYLKEPKTELKWLRPSEIKTNPKFCNDFSFPLKFNFVKGKLGNLWYLEAISLLTMNKELFQQVVPCDQTFETPQYAGNIIVLI